MKYFLTILLSGISLCWIDAQAQSLDTELWTDVNASFKVNKRIDLGTEVGYRLENNVSTTKIFYVEPDIDFELTKKLDLSVSYRFSSLPNKTPDIENRLSSALSYKIDAGKLDFRLRSKFQYDFIPNDVNQPVWRNRLKMDYNLSKKVDPFFATELFFYGNPKSEFEQLRLLGGLNFNLPKGMEFDLYYMLRNKFNVGTPGNYHTIGISFDFGKLN